MVKNEKFREKLEHRVAYELRFAKSKFRKGVQRNSIYSDKILPVQLDSAVLLLLAHPVVVNLIGVRHP